MAKVYMLVGVPGAGKSTWLKAQEWAKDMPILSTDKYIDEYAEKQGKTYNEVFEEYIRVATDLMNDEVKDCHAKNIDVIWDQTNVTAKSRKQKLAKLPGYEAIAVMFNTPPADELTRRLASRPGKLIPDHAMETMIKNLQEPTKEEGFTEIWNA